MERRDRSIRSDLLLDPREEDGSDCGMSLGLGLYEGKRGIGGAKSRGVGFTLVMSPWYDFE